MCPNFSSTDSSRQGGTSNLKTHLKLHGISATSPGLCAASLTSLEKWTKSKAPEMSVEEALKRWVVNTRQPFTVVEHEDFQAIFTAARVSLPIRSAETLRRRIVGDFEVYRGQLREDLRVTCISIALSLDVWTSENGMPILWRNWALGNSGF